MSVDYGKDISCTDSLRTGRLVTGIELLGQAAYRRLITPRGKLRGGPQEEIYGEDLLAYVGKDARQTKAKLPGIIQAQLLQDERIESVATTVTTATEGASTTFFVSIDIAPTDSTDSLTLKLAVSEVSVELLGIEAQS